MYVCICKGITDSQIQQALENGADYKTLREELGVATDCGQCGNHCKSMARQNSLQPKSNLFHEIKAA